MSLKSIIEEFLANPPIQQGYFCKLSKILDTLNADDHKALMGLVDNEEISAAAISKLLVENGYDIKPANVLKHRRRGAHNGCRCRK